MIVPTYHGVRDMDSDGFFYFEGQASTEAEVMEFSTAYSVGSVIFCTGEDKEGKASLFILSLDLNNKKYWKKVV